MRRLPKRDPIQAGLREAVAERVLGIYRECYLCGESRPLALERNSHPRICTECKRKSQEKTPMDNHHPAGKANSPITITVPANDHRARLSEDQRDWPPETLQNPDGSPLLIAAACIRGFIDVVVYLMEQLLMWVAEMLEILNAHLVETFGPKWWRNTKVENFAGRRNPNAKSQSQSQS